MRGGKEKEPRVRARKKEGGGRRGIERARVKDTEKVFLVAHSVCKMGSQPCTHRILPPYPPSLCQRMYGRPCAWIVSVPNRPSGVFKARRG